MFKHLFKLIWNKKKQNALLITEMFISFLVIFAVSTMAVYAYRNYRQPMGLEYADVWVVNYQPPANIRTLDSVYGFQEALRREVKAMPAVLDVTYSGNNVPFSMNSSNSTLSTDDKRRANANFYTVEEAYPGVLGMKMKSGRWVTKSDLVSNVPAVVINARLEEALFDGTDAVGRYVHTDMEKLKVVGVVENAKEKGAYQVVESGMYRHLDSNAARWTGTMLLKMKPGTGASFESGLFRTLSDRIGSSIEIEHLDEKLASKNRLSLVPMIILFVVGGFLVINVALGLFGVLWYNISKRRGEIGLRRAVGASGASVSRQLVQEALFLATLALLIGLFFAVQFPILHVFDLPSSVYVAAIGLSVAFIYILVFLCALYPGRQAAAIYPAVALHEE
ncbi:ABC transporter permease [Flaviaesturariibacter amylovorans]|uniref:FtsX-like permease family protein n=1 Tax=Flaviaesturariibacter amylovorans TaxID=1084520 RepID=A0ABP8H7F9_9BACT